MAISKSSKILASDVSGKVDTAGTGLSKSGTTLSLKASGVTAGSYGPSANASPAHGKTFSVPYLTVDTYGRLTSCSTKTITLPNAGASAAVSYITSTSLSQSWYCVYSNGFIAQGGYINSQEGRTTRTVTFPKAFTNTTYAVLSNGNEGGAGGATGGEIYWNVTQVKAKTKTTCNITASCEEQIAISWIAFGY